MRQMFPGYYQLTDEEFAILWETCLFVFDASVLLNLYRYPKKASDDLLRIMTNVSERVWIPHQVALEYQSNRLSVIAKQMSRYREVEDILVKAWGRLEGEFGKLQLRKRHASIDPDALLGRVRDIFDEFRGELQTLRGAQPDVLDDDSLRNEIESLFEGKIGPPPSCQDKLDRIYKEGATRYRHDCPPGYMDARGKKEKSENEAHFYQGMILKRRYGDLLMWYQIIDKMKSDDKRENLILVTDDDTEDWWWRVGSDGEKTIGPRPELVGEMRTKGGVSLFHMYSSERFMEYAKQYLEADVDHESIAQVRDIVQFGQGSAQLSVRQWAMIVESAVRRYLEANYPDMLVQAGTPGYVDFLLADPLGRSMGIGYEVKTYHRFSSFVQAFRKSMIDAQEYLSTARLNRFTLVFVASTDMIRKIAGWLDQCTIPKGASVIVGEMIRELDTESIGETPYVFYPMFHFPSAKKD